MEGDHPLGTIANLMKEEIGLEADYDVVSIYNKLRYLKKNYDFARYE